MNHEILTANIETFTNPRGLPSHDISISALANTERLSIEDYRKQLWEKIKDGKGKEFNELGYLARQSNRGEIVLLIHEDPPNYLSVVISAIRRHQRELARLAVAENGADGRSERQV